VLRLKEKTDPGWAQAALADVPALLTDHAHCEKKAAATALALITTYPEHAVLCQPLAHLAQEETRHFFSVVSELTRRGLCLGRDGGDPYAAGLLAAAAPNGPERLRDRLLIAALIEARSCERFGLLASAAPKAGEERLARFWASLFEAEARHHTLFMSLATEIFGEENTRARMAELQVIEADLCRRLPHRAAIH
jgi:tRNA 2-(methylsulfanyl)-N6-isopentenyladenosine37 hydroxylase